MGPYLYRQMVVDAMRAALANARAARLALGPVAGAALWSTWIERARDAARELTSVRLAESTNGPEHDARGEGDRDQEQAVDAIHPRDDAEVDDDHEVFFRPSTVIE